jgi:hypothetical protein
LGGFFGSFGNWGQCHGERRGVSPPVEELVMSYRENCDHNITPPDDAQTTPHQAPSGRVLLVVEGPDRGRACPLGETPVAVGRGREDSFILRDACVTSRQLVVEWDPAVGRHVLRQTGDSGTAINNIPLSRLAGVRHALMEGDQIQVGGTTMRYCHREDLTGPGRAVP